MSKFKKVEGILYNYKKIKAEITNIDIDIDIIKNEYEGVGSVSYEEKTGPTNAFSSRVENEILDREKRIFRLEKDRRYKELQIKKIDNAISFLDERERRLVLLKYFEKRTHMYIAEHLGYEEKYIYELKVRVVNKLESLVL